MNKIEKNFAEYEQLEKENKNLENQLPVIDTIKAQENEIMQKYNMIRDEYNKTNEEIKNYIDTNSLEELIKRTFMETDINKLGYISYDEMKKVINESNIKSINPYKNDIFISF